MRFMMIIKANQDSEAGVMPSAELMTAMGNFNEEMVKAGVMTGGEGLLPSSAGARVNYSQGKTTVVEGPFHNPSELVAGFWTIQVKDKAEAIAWARKIPLGTDSDTQVELRQIAEVEDFADAPAEVIEQERRLRAEGAKTRH